VIIGSEKDKGKKVMKTSKVYKVQFYSSYNNTVMTLLNKQGT